VSPLETAVVFLGLDGLAGPAAVVYVVRRLAPWPKPPAPQQPPGQSRRGGQTQASAPASPPADGERAGSTNSTNSTVPSGGNS
jgi:hypothetical protein